MRFLKSPLKKVQRVLYLMNIALNVFSLQIQIERTFTDCLPWATHSASFFLICGHLIFKQHNDWREEKSKTLRDEETCLRSQSFKSAKSGFQTHIFVCGVSILPSTCTWGCDLGGHDGGILTFPKSSTLRSVDFMQDQETHLSPLNFYRISLNVTKYLLLIAHLFKNIHWLLFSFKMVG